jgi:Uncharacterized proteins, homologs of microcin C7 resistance protein MccF
MGSCPPSRPKPFGVCEAVIGTVRLIEDLIPALVFKKRKWIIGFVSVTVLHSFSNIILNTASIHATMPINVIENTADSLTSFTTSVV